jgi:hypothetical protein
MSAPSKPLGEYESVQTWFRGLREQSGIEPADDPSRLRLLGEFCSFMDLDPDQLVSACLLKKEGRETKISIKGRRSIGERIAEFQSRDASGDSRERGKRGNTVRSFLIHNGILLQAGMQI